MSGNGRALAALHAHFGDRLAHSMLVGHSHHESPLADIVDEPRPQFFFAPTEGARLTEEWGREELQRRSGEALASFVTGSHDWLTVEPSRGVAAAEATWQDVVAGQVPPSAGRIVSLHD
jgi:hypothetical protein